MRTKESGASRKSGSTTKGNTKMQQMNSKNPSQLRGRTSQSGPSGKGSHAPRKSSSGKKGSHR